MPPSGSLGSGFSTGCGTTQLEGKGGHTGLLGGATVIFNLNRVHGLIDFYKTDD
jgi:hypothetical protein